MAIFKSTLIFQPLDLTVNSSTKLYLKRQFTKWFSARISDERDSEFGTKDLKSLGPFASVYPLDEAMADLTVTTAADTDVDSFVTPKESYVSLW